MDGGRRPRSVHVDTDRLVYYGTTIVSHRSSRRRLLHDHHREIEFCEKDMKL